jgi:ADP-ribosylglycohydrolase
MLGAIAGDVIGSVYEWDNCKSKDFPLIGAGCFFTDDTVLTVAVAEAVLLGRATAPLLKDYYRRWPDAGYGGRFADWAEGPDMGPYNSWGNGAAMRISPVGFAFDTLDEVLKQAAVHTAVTHNHPEGIKGAQATAAAIFLARTGSTRVQIKSFVEGRFGYDLSRTLDQMRPGYTFDESCQRTVPQAITAFLESVSFEDAIRNAISLGGDSDTLACITGGIAEAFYGGVPAEIAAPVLDRLHPALLNVTRMFCLAHGLSKQHFTAA